MLRAGAGWVAAYWKMLVLRACARTGIGGEFTWQKLEGFGEGSGAAVWGLRQAVGVVIW